MQERIDSAVDRQRAPPEGQQTAKHPGFQLIDQLSLDRRWHYGFEMGFNEHFHPHPSTSPALQCNGNL